MGEMAELRTQVESLLTQFHAGRRAQEQLLELSNHYRPYLLAIGNSDLAAPARAQHGASDLFQDLWFLVREHLHQFRGTTEAEFKGWLRTIYVNQLKHINARAERRVAAVDELPTASNWPAPSAALRATEEEVARRQGLNRLLTGLPEKERVILVLREAFDFKYVDIAYVLGETEDHVRYLCNRSKAAAHLSPPDESA
jgi:RNA polymerase sigma factor (sigma-70 family)